MRYQAPLNCGRRLLPVVIDERARNEPDRVWASFPIDDYDLAQGYEEVTYAAFANAINKLAWFIVKIMGRSVTFETLAYLGVPDVRYHILQMAACKTGYKVLFSSQLNSLEIHLSLMDKTSCSKLLSTVGVHTADILAGRTMLHAVIPDLDDLLALDHRAPIFPYTKTWNETAQDPYLVLHSSGTTGDPKPVVINHAGIATLDAHCLPPDVEGRQHWLVPSHPGNGVRFLAVTAHFHVISAVMCMCMSIFGGGVMVLGYRHRGVTTSDIFDILDHAVISKAILTPWMMEDIAVKANARSYIERFDAVSFGGAVLSSRAAEIWSKYTHIQNAWGSTECFGPPQLMADKGDHAYVYFDPVHSGIEFRSLETDLISEEDGFNYPLYEMVFTLTPETAPYSAWHAREGITLQQQQDSHAGSEPLPAYPEYAIGDLWVPHPDPKKASYAWRYAGRKDDVLVFSTGVNWHPGPTERAIMAHPHVRAVLTVGTQRRQPLVLVELIEGFEIEHAAVLQDIWETAISPVNDKVAAHGCVAKTHIVLLPAGELIRTAKGSVVRKKTELKFASKIDEVYAEFGDVFQEGKKRYGSISKTTEILIEEEVDCYL